MLIDKEMQRKDLEEVVEISLASITKLGKGANITTNLLKSWEAVDCKLEDIMKTIKDQEIRRKYNVKSIGCIRK